jgi:hypothetical protein
MFNCPLIPNQVGITENRDVLPKSFPVKIHKWAIALYNDTVATGDNDPLAITNQALRELSGVNGLLYLSSF